MKHLVIIITAFLFLAFRQDVEAVDTKPAFPEWVESTNDPPDSNLEAAPFAEAIYIVIEAPEQILFIRPTTALEWSTETRISTQPKPFVYTPCVSAGGVGRLYGSKGLLNNLATVRLILSSTSGGLSRIRN